MSMLIRFTQPYPPYELQEEADLPDTSALYFIYAGFAEEIAEMETATVHSQLETATIKRKPRKRTR